MITPESVAKLRDGWGEVTRLLHNVVELTDAENGTIYVVGMRSVPQVPRLLARFPADESRRGKVESS